MAAARTLHLNWFNQQTQKFFFPTAFSCWGNEEQVAIDRVRSSNQFTMGLEVAALEREFADFHEMRYGIAVNSGSSANFIAVAALFHRKGQPLLRGDKVVVPALAWSTTYAPCVQHGLDLVLADCNDQWNVGPYHGASVSVQIVCSILGNPAHFWVEAPWPIIEDNCESLGAVDLKGRKCGTRGLMNTFSFFYSHQISAVEGGMILTNDEECARLCRVLRAHGWTRDVDHALSFDSEYNFILMGMNVRLTELYAAIAREQLRKLPAMIALRHDNMHYFWKRALQEDLPLRRPVGNGDQSPFGLHFEVADGETRSRLVAALRANSIDCRLPTGGSFRRHAYGAPWRDQRTPRADRVHDCGLFLGNGPLDLSEQIERAVRVMRGVL